MTMGSPFHSAASGPGCAETYATFFESGDQAISLPVVGSGAFVLSSGPRYFLAVPSGCATMRPLLPLRWPEYAIHVPSGDHSGLPDVSIPSLRQIDLRSASVMIQTCPTGRIGPSLRRMV